MRIGVIFPHVEFGSDRAAVKDYAQAAEALGYRHIGADDHVIGPNPQRPGGWTGWVTYQSEFYEPFVLFSFLAAVTERVEMETCVLLLPQRQTVLVAKQAAGLDLLSGGRLRLGIGIGWNQVEYQSLGADFHNRGRRVEEQIAVLRGLWSAPLLDFHGRWHTIPDAGMAPPPVQRPIPIWIGGQSAPAIERAARLANGWMPLYKDAQGARAGLEMLDRGLEQAGRPREGFGLEARIPYGVGDAGEWERLLAGWQAVGATHISLITTGCGFQNAREHIAAMEKFAATVEMA